MTDLTISLELTDRQLKRQDYVDQCIYEMLCAIVGGHIEWDMEVIAAVRDVAVQEVCRATGVSEMNVYPYIPE